MGPTFASLPCLLLLAAMPPAPTDPPPFVRTIGSSGAGAGQLDIPVGVAIDGEQVYVTEYQNDRVSVFARDGGFLRSFGGTGTGEGQFLEPWGIAVLGNGNVAVADDDPRLQVLDPNGLHVATVKPFLLEEGQLYSPKGVALGPLQALHVVDSIRAQVVRFDAALEFAGLVGSSGFGPGQLSQPAGVAVAADGSVYVTDTGGDRIHRYAADGDLLDSWGGNGTGDGQFNEPLGLAVGTDGTVYVADTFNHRVQAFTAEGEHRVTWGSVGAGEGQFVAPIGIALDADGAIYVADSSNDRVQVFGPLPGGSGPTPAPPVAAGAWGKQGTGNGRFETPRDVQVDAEGRVFVVDEGAAPGAGRVQRFSPKGKFEAAFALPGLEAPAALLLLEAGELLAGDETGGLLRLDAAGGVLEDWGDAELAAIRDVVSAPGGGYLVSDPLLNRIARLDAQGDFAGVFAENFAASPGSFSQPGQLAVDASGDVLVADTGNQRVLRFDSAGELLGAFGAPGADVGELDAPAGVAAVPGGDAWVVDTGNRRLQRFDAEGGFQVAFGKAGKGKGQFDGPLSAAVDALGVLFVVDAGNHRIQRFAPPASARRPDARLRAGREGEWTGDDVYEKTGKQQLVALESAPGEPAEFTVSIQNDGSEADRFTLAAKGKTGAHVVTWLDGRDDVSAAVASGTWTSDVLLPGESQELTVNVVLADGTQPGKSLVRKLRLRSLGSAKAQDVARLAVTAAAPAP